MTYRKPVRDLNDAREVAAGKKMGYPRPPKKLHGDKVAQEHWRGLVRMRSEADWLEPWGAHDLFWVGEACRVWSWLQDARSSDDPNQYGKLLRSYRTIQGFLCITRYSQGPSGTGADRTAESKRLERRRKISEGLGRADALRIV